MEKIFVEILSWAGVVTAIAGQMLINRKNILAYPVWILSCVFMIITSFFKKDYSILTLYLVYFALNIEGLYHWKKGSKPN